MVEDKKVEEMTFEEMRAELIEWRAVSPKIKQMCNDLCAFRQFAKTPEELDQKIVALDAKHKATIELREKQLQDMMELIRQYQADPIGVGHHIEELANTKLKLS